MEEGFREPVQKGYDWHHVRPGSRGGLSDRSNLIYIPRHTLHDPYHKIFRNLWPHEAALLLFFCWETQNPFLDGGRYNHTTLYHVERAWQILFDGNQDKETAIRTLRRTILPVQSAVGMIPESISQMCHAKQLIDSAKHYGFSNKNLAEGKVMQAKFAKEDLAAAYSRLFGMLYPHEAIMLTFLSWRTACASEECGLPQTLKDKENTPAKKTFATRIKVWKWLFQDLDKWGVMEKIAGEFAGIATHHALDNSVSRALRLCHELEHLSCIQ